MKQIVRSLQQQNKPKHESKPEPPPERCTASTPEYCHAPGSRREEPDKVAAMWASWLGIDKIYPTVACATFRFFWLKKPPVPMSLYYRWGDRMTEEMWASPEFQKVYAQIVQGAATDGTVGRVDYHYSDMGKLESYAHLASDMLSHVTLGREGSNRWIAVTGSFDAEWQVVGYDRDNPVVEVHVQNATTLYSGTRIPGITPKRGDGNSGSGADVYPGERYLIQSYRFRQTVCVNSECAR